MEIDREERDRMIREGGREKGEIESAKKDGDAGGSKREKERERWGESGRQKEEREDKDIEM